MSKYWNQVTRNIQPYIPGEQPQDKQYIKLNTNENPYPPAPGVIKAIARACSNLNLYPDPDCREFRETVARYYKLSNNQVFAGNGSDEILAFAFMAFFEPGKPIVFPDITYSFYIVYCSILGINYDRIPLDNDFNIPVELFCQNNGGVVIPNPNAPTGKLISLAQVEYILENNPEHVVILDEAYIDFGGESAINLIEYYPNLLVVQTLSKSRALAGLRAGVALGHPDLIEGLNRVKNSLNSYTLDRLALAGAAAAFADETYFQETRQKIIKTRAKTIADLSKLGFKVIPSSSNFIFVTHQYLKAPDLFRRLKENGILVRYFNQDRIENYLRISIGTDKDMEQFVITMEKLLHNS